MSQSRKCLCYTCERRTCDWVQRPGPLVVVALATTTRFTGACLFFQGSPNSRPSKALQVAQADCTTGSANVPGLTALTAGSGSTPVLCRTTSNALTQLQPARYHDLLPELALCGDTVAGYVVKDSPQPHVPLAFGLMKTNSDLHPCKQGRRMSCFDAAKARRQLHCTACSHVNRLWLVLQRQDKSAKQCMQNMPL